MLRISFRTIFFSKLKKWFTILLIDQNQKEGEMLPNKLSIQEELFQTLRIEKVEDEEIKKIENMSQDLEVANEKPKNSKLNIPNSIIKKSIIINSQRKISAFSNFLEDSKYNPKTTNINNHQFSSENSNTQSLKEEILINKKCEFELDSWYKNNQFSEEISSDEEEFYNQHLNSPSGFASNPLTRLQLEKAKNEEKRATIHEGSSIGFYKIKKSRLDQLNQEINKLISSNRTSVLNIFTISSLILLTLFYTIFVYISLELFKLLVQDLITLVPIYLSQVNLIIGNLIPGAFDSIMRLVRNGIIKDSFPLENYLVPSYAKAMYGIGFPFFGVIFNELMMSRFEIAYSELNFRNWAGFEKWHKEKVPLRIPMINGSDWEYKYFSKKQTANLCYHLNFLGIRRNYTINKYMPGDRLFSEEAAMEDRQWYQIKKAALGVYGNEIMMWGLNCHKKLRNIIFYIKNLNLARSVASNMILVIWSLGISLALFFKKKQIFEFYKNIFKIKIQSVKLSSYIWNELRTKLTCVIDSDFLEQEFAEFDDEIVNIEKVQRKKIEKNKKAKNTDRKRVPISKNLELGLKTYKITFSKSQIVLFLIFLIFIAISGYEYLNTRSQLRIFEGLIELLNIANMNGYLLIPGFRCLNMMMYNNTITYFDGKTDLEKVQEEMDLLFPIAMDTFDRIDQLPFGRYEQAYRNVFKKGGSTCETVKNTFPSPCSAYLNSFFNKEARTFYKGYFTILRDNLRKFDEERDSEKGLRGLLGSKFMRDQYWAYLFAIGDMSVYLGGDLIDYFRTSAPEYISFVRNLSFRANFIRGLLSVVAVLYLIKEFSRVSKKFYFVMKMFPCWLLEENWDLFMRLIKEVS